MQALIDFDGWRKWKDFSSQSNQSKPSTPLPGTGKSPKSAGLANGKVVPPGGKKKKEETGMHLGLVGKDKVVGVEEGTGRERDGSDETTGTDTNGDDEGK